MINTTTKVVAPLIIGRRPRSLAFDSKDGTANAADIVNAINEVFLPQEASVIGAQIDKGIPPSSPISKRRVA